MVKVVCIDRLISSRGAFLQKLRSKYDYFIIEGIEGIESVLQQIGRRMHPDIAFVGLDQWLDERGVKYVRLLRDLYPEIPVIGIIGDLNNIPRNNALDVLDRNFVLENLEQVIEKYPGKMIT